jgi:hypothetical protein
MAINQRNFTSSTTDGIFTYDRFGVRLTGDGTGTVSAETFTPGTAPVAGYEAANYIRFVTTGQTSAAVRTVLRQTIESVRTFAGQTVTLSFWAKAATGTPEIAANFFQSFGSGGSANVNAPAGTVTISTSWARYSLTVAIPSISGKTIGTGNGLGVDIAVSAGSTFNTEFSSIGIQTGTFDIWGIQVEAGSQMTPFQTASGSIQGELAMCQRYYYAHASGNSQPIAIATSYTTTLSIAYLQFPVTMRATPSIVVATGTNYYGQDIAGTGPGTNTLTIGAASTTGARLDGTYSGLTAGEAGYLRTNNASASLAFSSEI